MPDITHIVDASALIAYFNGELGSEHFAELLTDEENILAIHIVNLCEVYYNYYRSDGQNKAEEVWAKALSFLRMLDNVEESFMKRVGRWKGMEGLGLGDAFAAAAAENDAVPLVTTDHMDFDPLDQRRILQIEWLR